MWPSSRHARVRNTALLHATFDGAREIICRLPVRAEHFVFQASNTSSVLTTYFVLSTRPFHRVEAMLRC
jgi:hypothetical protein